MANDSALSTLVIREDEFYALRNGFIAFLNDHEVEYEIFEDNIFELEDAAFEKFAALPIRHKRELAALSVYLKIRSAHKFLDGAEFSAKVAAESEKSLAATFEGMPVSEEVLRAHALVEADWAKRGDTSTILDLLAVPDGVHYSSPSWDRFIDGAAAHAADMLHFVSSGANRDSRRRRALAANLQLIRAFFESHAPVWKGLPVPSTPRDVTLWLYANHADAASDTQGPVFEEHVRLYGTIPKEYRIILIRTGGETQFHFNGLLMAETAKIKAANIKANS